MIEENLRPCNFHLAVDPRRTHPLSTHYFLDGVAGCIIEEESQKDYDEANDQRFQDYPLEIVPHYIVHGFDGT